MDLELLSFIVIGLLAAAIGTVSFARAKTRGWVRTVLTIFAFLLMVPAFLGMMIVILGIK